jgi:hypothetical protein
MKAYADGPVSLELAMEATGTHARELDPAAPLPWDFVQHAYPRATLERAHSVMMRRLAG